MEALGATLVDGVWQYEGEPVEISVLIRTEDERRSIGDYVATQLESIGFTVIRDYKTAAEASPSGSTATRLMVCSTSTPAAGSPRRCRATWAATCLLLHPQWPGLASVAGIHPQRGVQHVAEILDNQLYATLEERRELMAQALDLAFEDSARIWLADRNALPRRAEINVAADLYGADFRHTAVGNDHSARRRVGGEVRDRHAQHPHQPWNPLPAPTGSST
jgi:peptide/nickel transport system substrate-binding protein